MEWKTQIETVSRRYVFSDNFNLEDPKVRARWRQDFALIDSRNSWLKFREDFRLSTIAFGFISVTIVRKERDRQPTFLLLGTGAGESFIFHLPSFSPTDDLRQHLPPDVIGALEDDQLLKVGLGVREAAATWAAAAGVTMQPLVETGTARKTCERLARSSMSEKLSLIHI